jgi:hypothetical protein
MAGGGIMRWTFFAFYDGVLGGGNDLDWWHWAFWRGFNV